jgi:opine dehydrogenase
MSFPKIAVLGAGNGAFITAADLSLKGFSVNMCEAPEFANNIADIQKIGGINLDVRGNPGIKSGFAKLNLITTDVEKAIENCDIVLIVVPAFGQRRFAELAAEHIKSEQIVVLEPGNFYGALEFAQVLKEKNANVKPTLVELECMIYSGFKDNSTTVWASGFKEDLKAGVFPSKDTEKALKVLKCVYPKLDAAKNVLETGLSNVNTVLHAPILVLNAGWTEKKLGKFLFYWDGCTPSVGKVVEAVDDERLEVGRALDLDLVPTKEVLIKWYGHQGAKGETLGEVLATNPAYEWDDAPKSLKHRFLLEDIPYGMVPMESLGKLAGVQTPITTSIINLACRLTGLDLREKARDLKTLKLTDVDIEDIKDLMINGIL